MPGLPAFGLTLKIGPMRIRLNGKDEDILEGQDLAALIQGLGLQGQAVAVEVNLDIIPRDKRATRILKESDEVEIVKFVGGGAIGSWTA